MAAEMASFTGRVLFVSEMRLKRCRVFQGYVAQATYQGPTAIDKVLVIDVAPQFMASGPGFELLGRE